MNEDREQIENMNLQCAINRRTQIQSAISAINQFVYTGVLPLPPSGIILPRWRAMVNSVIKNGGF